MFHFQLTIVQSSFVTLAFVILFQKEKSLVEEAAYFMKFAVGAYGWALYVFMNPCTGPWNLCGEIKYLLKWKL